MITIRRAAARGHANHGWLDTWHTFSFADYYDPEQMGFRALRVINEDRVSPGMGFGTHGHRDMEIITYVLEGELEHRDSLGHGEVIRPGEVQVMTAGRGIQHSEFNPSADAPVHLLQIWIVPEARGLAPRYDQRQLGPPEPRLRLLVAEDGEAPLSIHQDAKLYDAALDAGTALEHDLAPGRHAWVQVTRGAVTVNGERLETSDGAAISDEARLRFEADGPAEILLFELP